MRTTSKSVAVGACVRAFLYHNTTPQVHRIPHHRRPTRKDQSGQIRPHHTTQDQTAPPAQSNSHQQKQQTSHPHPITKKTVQESLKPHLPTSLTRKPQPPLFLANLPPPPCPITKKYGSSTLPQPLNYHTRRPHHLALAASRPP